MWRIIRKSEKGKKREHHEDSHRIGKSHRYSLSEILWRNRRLTVCLNLSERIRKRHRETENHKHCASGNQNDVLVVVYELLRESKGEYGYQRIHGIDDTCSQP